MLNAKVKQLALRAYQGPEKYIDLLINVSLLGTNYLQKADDFKSVQN